MSRAKKRSSEVAPVASVMNLRISELPSPFESVTKTAGGVIKRFLATFKSDNKTFCRKDNFHNCLLFKVYGYKFLSFLCVVCI